MVADAIRYIDRTTGQECIEKVYGDFFVRLLYGQGTYSSWMTEPLQRLACRNPAFSRLMGWYQNLSCTRKCIAPFTKAYAIDTTEFLKPLEAFTSFNDFFYRELKPEARPIASHAAIMPTDGRYYFYNDISKATPFDVKGSQFDLGKFLHDDALAARYQNASMVLGRLCPSDYHRFHFPIDCVPSESTLINGYLYSVNPLAIRKNAAIFWQNKRILTTLASDVFGEVLCVEIGATSVGTITQTFTPNQTYAKGAEKGYFSFGGSAIALLFPSSSIRFDNGLLDATARKMEIRCLLGQSMGEA